jgi:hypothetical protein
MPLPKKYVVQKSFRIDAKLESDLEYLSDKLNRPQNELVNLALEQFMWENRQWFIENLLIDYCDDYFEFDQEHSHCEIGGVTIDLKVNDDCSTTMYFCCRNDDGNIVDETTETYPDSSDLQDKLKYKLKQISLNHLMNRQNSIEPILKQRLDYK